MQLSLAVRCDRDRQDRKLYFLVHFTTLAAIKLLFSSSEFRPRASIMSNCIQLTLYLDRQPFDLLESTSVVILSAKNFGNAVAATFAP
ncbi:hypothetical protein [Chamaesiphon sp. OTE_20_metabat_361]|uniref:hypothetical protein n=1 Tax=Chamaesiphon sp. OTE_20_metabat_361 TaxID=2964689 RepID=UPI00286B1BB4|nr:hypothetical protein [Chamaesiphon sp. OTE_20_metabat_361]